MWHVYIRTSTSTNEHYLGRRMYFSFFFRSITKYATVNADDTGIILRIWLTRSLLYTVTNVLVEKIIRKSKRVGNRKTINSVQMNGKSEKLRFFQNIDP